MFKRKRYIRLDEIQGMPQTPELKRLLFESNRARGSTVELPWRSLKTKLRYSITVCFEVDRIEPIWSLYQGEGAQSRMVWTQSFKDPELLNDVISLSLPAEGQAEQLPDTTINERDKHWNPTLDRSRHTYTTSEVELLSPLDTELPPKPDSEAFFTLSPLEKEDAEHALRSTEPNHTDHELAPDAAIDNGQEIDYAAHQAQQAQQMQQMQGQPGFQYPPGYDPNLHAPPQPGYAYPPGYPPPYPAPYPGYPYPPQDPAAYAVAGYPPGYPQGYPGYPPMYPPQDPNAYPPGYPQQYAPPPGYQPYPPGYQVPPGMQPYPQQGQFPPQFAPAPGTVVVPRVTADSDLIAKRPNILLGDFLVETGLIPETTLEAALQLQGMVRNGSLSTGQAAEAVRRAHNRGGEVEQFSPSTPAPDGSTAKVNAPPLGEILVEAGLIRISILKAALNLQEVVRTGALTKEEAIDAFLKEHFGKGENTVAQSNAEKDQKVLDLFIKAKLIQPSDIEAAEAVRKKHGGDVPKILQAAGKFDKMTFEAAAVCQNLLDENRIKIEQAIIALHYCQRSRVSFDDAIEELGWEKP